MSWIGYLPQDLRDMLDKDERIYWAEKPKRAPLVFKSLAAMVIILPFMIIPIFILQIAGSVFFNPIVIIFFLFWYGILSIFAIAPLYNFLMWRNIWYVLTNKRVIIRTGLIGIDYDILELENIQQVNVNVGLIDKIYGTGTIVLQSIGVKPVALWAVKEPYKIQKTIRQAVEEAKNSHRFQ
ncbi:MAG: hypothetical protein DRJ38_10095 [Thermoprotei archaeon]|nr:MAG: hypothetical protein DRJ38_10095 [Thermoprotei archaeon]